MKVDRLSSARGVDGGEGTMSADFTCAGEEVSLIGLEGGRDAVTFQVFLFGRHNGWGKLC